MTYVFTPGIPLGGDIPAQSAPLIAANFSYLNAMMNKDHNMTDNSSTNADGAHKQVSLINEAAPAIPVGTNGVLYSDGGVLYWKNAIGIYPIPGQPQLYTPGLAGSTGAGTPTFTLNEGRWQQVGGIVYVNFNIVGAMAGVPNGAAITSFPLTPYSSIGNLYKYIGSVTCYVGGAWRDAVLSFSSGGMSFQQPNGTAVPMYTGNFDIRGNIFYFVS